MGLPIAALAAASSMDSTDLFEMEQPGISVKLTKQQLAELLFPEPALFSGLAAIDTVNDADLFALEQSGVIKKLSKSQLITLLALGYLTVDQTILKQNGDIVSYDGSNHVTGQTPRWRVVPQAAYTEAAPASSSTITFAGGGPTDGVYLKAGQYFSVGSPVRVVQGSLTYYGICTAVTDTLLTISGAAITTFNNIVSLSVGSKDMVKHVQMRSATTNYPATYPAFVTKGCTHLWKGPTGYLCSYSCAHMNTSATTQILLRFGGRNTVTYPAHVIPAAGTATTYGAFVDLSPGNIQQSLCYVSDGEKIIVITSPLGGSADYLIVCMTFVVP